MTRRFALHLALALAAAGCDCGTQAHLHELDHTPQVGSEVSELRENDLCAPVDDALVLKNSGQGPLTISAITVEGTGFELQPVTLPLVIEAAASYELRFHATDGDAVLHVKSDDPKTPDFTVPLHAHANKPPAITITAPVAGAIVDEGQDLLLQASVTDDADDPASLATVWTATTTGELSHLPPDHDGNATAHWNALGRPHGSQTVTLTATDHCGQTTTATVPLCFDGQFSYEPFHLEGWHYEGSATWDAAAGNLLLTPAVQAVAGSAFETSQQVGGENVDITFGFYVGGGTGADGFSLTALDTSREHTFLGPQGCGIGYGGGSPCTSGDGLPGWSVEVDTYYNVEVDQTQDDHVAFTFDGALVNQPIWKALPDINDSQWHTMRVTVHAPHVQVAIDGTTYLDSDVSGNFHFPAVVGFTAATGGQTDEHRIRALQVTGRYCSGS